MPPARKTAAGERNDTQGVVRIAAAQPADPFDQEAVADLRHTRGLRESYARVFRWAMLAQVFVADVIFVVYAWAGKHWNLQAPVMDVWLSATVVQVVAI